MWTIHAIKSAVRVDGTPRRFWRVWCWQSSAPFPTAAATAAETSFSAAQRCFKKRSERLSEKVFEVHSRNHGLTTTF
jgi:hypothetical protein